MEDTTEGYFFCLVVYCMCIISKSLGFDATHKWEIILMWENSSKVNESTHHLLKCLQDWGLNYQSTEHKVSSLLTFMRSFWIPPDHPVNSVKWQKCLTNGLIEILLPLFLEKASQHIGLQGQRSPSNSSVKDLANESIVELNIFVVPFPRCSHSMFDVFAILTARLC